MTERGSPSTILRPKFRTAKRETTASSACTMCSIHTMVTPDCLIFWISATSSTHSASVRPPAISSSRRSCGPLAKAVERAGAAIGESDQARALENIAAGVHHVRFTLLAAVDRRDQEILEYRQIFERMRYLERAPDAGDAAGARRRVRDVAAIEVDGA